MELTKKMLKDWNACPDGFAWWISHELETVESTIECLIGEEKFEWANWLISQVLISDVKVQYAIYAARSVLKIYEDKYPEDPRPRKAIEAAEKYLELKGAAARDAAWAAWAAALIDIIKFGVSILK